MPHLLKRLELNGFKSFAQKTVFDFPEGITAIVGPNGSGKSNVIDAIRWLLGERDAKSLRGGKSEDLIFGGTSGRSRLGQAQASLCFSNESNYFPVDFTEVVVSRRVNRDGKNQYFLNEAEVRLKDVIDFFAQVRLGARGLVVITQGNSDVFIRVSPRERREMIEGLLGLREYEIKKAEAERRLSHTQINLDKVHALTEEILPHLRSLKRQTSKWEKRSALEEELRGLENDFFGSARQSIEGGMKEIDVKLKKKQSEFVALESTLHEAEAQLKQVESAQPEEREELEGIKKKTRELLDERSRLQKEIGRLEARLEFAGASVDDALPSQHELISLIETIKKQLGAITYNNLATVEEKISILLGEIDKVVARKAKGKTVLPDDGTIDAELSKIRALLADIEHGMKELADREMHLEKSQNDFYAAFKKAVSEVDVAKKNVERWESERREIQFEKERLSLRMAEWERQVEQAGRRPDEFLGAKPNMLDGGREDCERRIFKLRGDLASIGDIDEALLKEARETETRYEFLGKESADLGKAREDLKSLIAELHGKIKSEFDEALVKINRELQIFFELMFDGGRAELVLAKPKQKKVEVDAEEAISALGEEKRVKDAVDIPEEAHVEEEGIEIELKLPKKRVASLEMLSGGERSLVGIAALFAMISVSPPPFLVLDEVDAPLDERNAKRFAEMLKQFSKETQFILVTHNRATMEAANILYGMTMNGDGTSKVVSLSLGEYATA